MITRQIGAAPRVARGSQPRCPPLKPICDLIRWQSHSGLQAILYKRADSSLPISGAYSMANLQAQELQTQRVQVVLLGSLSCLALLLAAVGLYGTVAHIVEQRTREMGIRLALGSSLSRAMLEVGRGGLTATLGGLALGVILSSFAARALSTGLFGVQPNDPLTFAVATIILGGIATVATLLPTLRISRLPLAETLMTE